MTGAVVNLAGEVKARHELAVDGRQGDDAVALVHRLAAELIALTDRPVLGIGVGSPGVVDARRHRRRRPQPRLGGHPARRAACGEALGVPVFVANDANTAVLGEHTFGDTGDGGLMVLRVGHRCRRRASCSRARCSTATAPPPARSATSWSTPTASECACGRDAAASRRCSPCRGCVAGSAEGDPDGRC